MLNWLSNSTVLKELLAARALCKEEVWTNYKILQINGLAEQEIFYKARKKMTDAWKARYPRPTVDVITEGSRKGESIPF